MAASLPLAGLPLVPATVASLLSGLRDAAGDVSLFLLVGGLVMLTVICLLVFVQNLLPDRGEDEQGAAPRQATRRLRALDGGALAQDLARRNGRNGRPVRRAVAPVDLAMDRLVELHVGEPRLLLAHDRMSRVRLYGCRGCAYGSGHSGPGQGCSRERAALDEVFVAIYGPRVRTQESACRRRGDAACEFEVVHA